MKNQNTSSKRKLTNQIEEDTKKPKIDDFHLSAPSWHPSGDVQQLSTFMRSEADNKLLQEKASPKSQIKVSVYKASPEETSQPYNKLVETTLVKSTPTQVENEVKIHKDYVSVSFDLNADGTSKSGSLKTVGDFVDEFGKVITPHPFAKFTTNKEIDDWLGTMRQKDFDDSNKNKPVSVVLISPNSSEGIDLKKIRRLPIRPWRQVGLDQGLGRAFRCEQAGVQVTSQYHCRPGEVIGMPTHVYYDGLMESRKKTNYSVMQAYQSTFGGSYYENTLDKCRQMERDTLYSSTMRNIATFTSNKSFKSSIKKASSFFKCSSLYAPGVMATLEDRLFPAFVASLKFNLAVMLDLAVNKYSWCFQPKESVTKTIVAIVKGMYIQAEIFMKYYCPRVTALGNLYMKDTLVQEKSPSVILESKPKYINPLRATFHDGFISGIINSVYTTEESKDTIPVGESTSSQYLPNNKEDAILYNEHSPILNAAKEWLEKQTSPSPDQTNLTYYSQILLPSVAEETTNSMYAEFLQTSKQSQKVFDPMRQSEGDIIASQYAQRGFISKKDAQMKAVEDTFEAITKNKILKEKYGYVCSCRKCALKESSAVLNEELFGHCVLFNLSMYQYKQLLKCVDAFPARYNASAESIKYSLEEVLDILLEKEINCVITSVQDLLLSDTESDEELDDMFKNTSIEQLDEILQRMTTQHKVLYRDIDSILVDIKTPFDVETFPDRVTKMSQDIDSADEIHWVEPNEFRSLDTYRNSTPITHWEEYRKIGTGKTCSTINIAEHFKNSGVSVYLMPAKKTSLPIDNSIFDE